MAGKEDVEIEGAAGGSRPGLVGSGYRGEEMGMALKVARFANLSLSMLVVAILLGTRLAFSPTMKSLPATEYVRVQQSVNATLGPLMPVFMVLAVLSVIPVLALLIRDRRSPDFALTLAGALCFVALTATTLVFNVPINAQVDGWSAESPPADWERLRDRWEAFHSVRTVLGTVGLLSLFLATVSTTPSRTDRAPRVS